MIKNRVKSLFAYLLVSERFLNEIFARRNTGQFRLIKPLTVENRYRAILTAIAASGLFASAVRRLLLKSELADSLVGSNDETSLRSSS